MGKYLSQIAQGLKKHTRYSDIEQNSKTSNTNRNIYTDTTNKKMTKRKIYKC